jgi:hypothetical protein
MFEQIAAMRHRMRSSVWCPVYFGVFAIFFGTLLLSFVTFPLLNLPGSNMPERVLYAICLYLATCATGILLAYRAVGPYRGTPAYRGNVSLIRGLIAVTGGSLTATTILWVAYGFTWVWPWWSS